MQINSCSDPDYCRGGCCRDFFGTKFCDVESNCVAAPTWIIILVPVILGLTALVLFIFVLVRLHNRKVIEIYDKIQIEHPASQLKQNQNIGKKNSHLEGQQSDRNIESDRPLRRKNP